MITKLLHPNSFKQPKKKIMSSYLKSTVLDKFSKDDISINRFSDDQRNHLVVEGQSTSISVEELCEREGISIKTFHKWSEDFLENSSVKTSYPSTNRNQDDRFGLVLEGKSGFSSIAEICNREGLTQDQFLEWTKEFLDYKNNGLDPLNKNPKLYFWNKEILINNSSLEVASYIENYLDFNSRKLLIVNNCDFQINDSGESYESIVNLQKINDIRYINKYFESVNSELKQNDLFIGCVETFSARRNRMKVNAIPIISSVYFMAEFILKRVLPKVSLSKKYYFDITKGSDRLLSKAETLGRLVSCGFKIMDYKSIGGLLYFVVKKDRKPYFDENPSYGPVYKMPRLGKNGKIIGVYKFRTMHPYSEYLQDYILKAHGYAETGKPANDFRIPVWGKLMRRFWLDELPQLINVLKGELKLVGVRPVSQRYFKDIPKEMQKLRLTQKPGCIPPYVALNREGSVMSVLQSEKDYLVEKIKHPYSTDIKYFLKAIYNIIINHKRSA